MLNRPLQAVWFFFLNCVYLTPLYREEGLLFLLYEHLSFVADKNKGEEEIRDIIQIFFLSI